MSKQAYALAPRILEVDALTHKGYPIIEAHPEVSFWALDAADLPPKSTWAGLERRKALLASAGIELPADLGDAGVAGPDDVLDAAVVAWTAHRYYLGGARTLPQDGITASHGAIWY